MATALLTLQEGRDFGVPLWRFTEARGEQIHAYAPRSLGDQDQDPQSCTNPNKVRGWMRAFASEWGVVDLGRFGEQDFALYVPDTLKDFSWLCQATVAHGSCIEVITPSELAKGLWSEINPIWTTARPLHYLRQTDLCSALGVPWVYLLGTYNYDPCLSVFLSDSEDMLTDVIDQTSRVQDCQVVPLSYVLDDEQRNWRRIYRQFDEPGK